MSTVSWHCEWIFLQYFASQLQYAPLASKFDHSSTQLQMLQKNYKLSYVLRTHFKLATLPLKSTKPKKKKNNKLKSSVNAS